MSNRQTDSEMHVMLVRREVHDGVATLVGTCPLCGERHRHGLPEGPSAPLGAGDGHRVQHCTGSNRPEGGGYVIREVVDTP